MGDRFVIKFVRIMALMAVVTLSLVTPALAQDPVTPTTPAAAGWTLINLSAAFGVGLVVIGAASGIGKLASAALESMARQPEVAGNIQTAMIIAAALIEGFTFFALYICMTAV
ncbi:MAG: ATP synthase F0 subunit C [Planctomycetia bacterium]|nr:ATP synthase F0 subunit C [Planctomycetia bacterium]